MHWPLSRSPKEYIEPVVTVPDTPELSLVRPVIERVNCMSFLVRRFMRYTEGDIFDVDGVNSLLLEAELSGKANIVNEPHITVANSRHGIELASYLRSRDVSILNIIQGTKRVAAKQPRSIAGSVTGIVNFGPDGIGNGDPDQDARHVVLLPDDKLSAQVKKDQQVIKNYLNGKARSITPHASILKARTTADAIELAEQLNQLVGGKSLPAEMGELIVSHSVARRLPAGFARDNHAVVLP